MFCSKCGTENDNNAFRCVQCGQEMHAAATTGATPPANVPNYLAQSIIVTLFCCWPFGIPAIVFSAQVNSKLASGDVEGAIDASNKAKMWAWVSFGVGMLAILFYVVVMLAAGFA